MHLEVIRVRSNEAGKVLKSLQFILLVQKYSGLNTQMAYLWETRIHGMQANLTSRINHLAAFTTNEASESLDRLISYDSLSSYRPYLLHAIEMQRIKRVDANYKQLTWREVQGDIEGAEFLLILQIYKL